MWMMYYWDIMFIKQSNIKLRADPQPYSSTGLVTSGRKTVYDIMSWTMCKISMVIILQKP